MITHFGSVPQTRRNLTMSLFAHRPLNTRVGFFFHSCDGIRPIFCGYLITSLLAMDMCSSIHQVDSGIFCAWKLNYFHAIGCHGLYQAMSTTVVPPEKAGRRHIARLCPVQQLRTLAFYFSDLCWIYLEHRQTSFDYYLVRWNSVSHFSHRSYIESLSISLGRTR